MDSTVEILLSTFNGEKHLSAQLDSVLNQDYPYWKMTVRDDGSTDETIAILNNYIQKYPDKIILLADDKGNIGYSNSFSELLKKSSAEYTMYCDQDDYWHPTKISAMLSVMLEEEVKLPAAAHIVFSDLHVTDSELKVVSQSFLNKMGYSPQKGMQVFFLKNYVPGCNLMFNRVLVQQVLQTDNIINLHDHWLLIVCLALGEKGRITYIDKPLMKYRLHDNNAIGFIEPDTSSLHKMVLFFKDCLKYGLSNKKYRNLLYSKNIQQVQNVCERLQEGVSKDAIRFSTIDGSNYFARKMRNVIRPYILERSLWKQLTYIICF